VKGHHVEVRRGEEEEEAAVVVMAVVCREIGSPGLHLIIKIKKTVTQPASQHCYSVSVAACRCVNGNYTFAAICTGRGMPS